MEDTFIKIIGFCFGFLVTTLGFWVAGFDFDHRGFVMLVWLIMSTYVGLELVFL